jgi:hypothetical protein
MNDLLLRRSILGYNKTAMPILRLVQPVLAEESIRRAKTLDDEYGFRQGFRQRTVEELIVAFNGGVGSRAWVSARAVYLTALRDALLATGLDCSSFISDESMTMDRAVERKGTAIVPVMP